jgi:hypothetical protein
MRYPYVKRSVNAYTIDKAVMIDGEEVFIKVATADTETYADSTSVDAINSMIMNVLDADHDWTIDLRDMQYASVFEEDNTFEMSRTNPKSLYRDRPDIKTGWRALVYKNIAAKSGDAAFESDIKQWSQWGRMITVLLQRVITENVRSGFMHNDLHLENVVYDTTTDTLRTLDYGRVVFDKEYMPKYTSLSTIREAIAPIRHMVDIPNIRAGWRYNIFGSTSVDHVTSASDMRWAPDIMKVCMLYYGHLNNKNMKVPFLEFNESTRQYQAVLKVFKSPESFTKAIKTTSKVFDPILPGIVLYAVVDSFLQKINYGIKLGIFGGMKGCWWYGGLVKNIVTEHVMTSAIIYIRDNHPEIMHTVMERSGLDCHFAMTGGELFDDSDTESDTESDDYTDAYDDFLFDHTGVHPTTLFEAAAMKAQRTPPPEPDADMGTDVYTDMGTDVYTDVYTDVETEPWHPTVQSLPQPVYGGAPKRGKVRDDTTKKAMTAVTGVTLFAISMLMMVLPR